VTPLSSALLAFVALLAAVSVSAGVIYALRIATSVLRTPLPVPDPPLSSYGGLELLEFRGVVTGGEKVILIRRGLDELELVGYDLSWRETESGKYLKSGDGERVRALLALAPRSPR